MPSHYVDKLVDRMEIEKDRCASIDRYVSIDHLNSDEGSQDPQSLPGETNRGRNERKKRADSIGCVTGLIQNDFLGFKLTVSVIAELIIKERCPDAFREFRHDHTQLTRYLIRQHTQMPGYLRAPLKILTIIFNFWSIPLTGRLFCNLPPEQQMKQVRSWRTSIFGLRRDFVKFYEKFTIFCFYSQRYG